MHRAAHLGHGWVTPPARGCLLVNLPLILPCITRFKEVLLLLAASSTSAPLVAHRKGTPLAPTPAVTGRHLDAAGCSLQRERAADARVRAHPHGRLPRPDPQPARAPGGG